MSFAHLARPQTAPVRLTLPNASSVTNGRTRSGMRAYVLNARLGRIRTVWVLEHANCAQPVHSIMSVAQRVLIGASYAPRDRHHQMGQSLARCA